MALDNQITDREYKKFKVSTATPTQTAIVVVNSDGSDVFSPTAGLDVNVHDGAATAITSTVVGADTGLDVNVIKGINVEVDLDAADDSVLVYGFDGSSNQKIKTDASGNVQVDVVASLPTGTNSIGDIANITNVVSVDDNGGSLTVDGTVAVTGTRGTRTPYTEESAGLPQNSIAWNSATSGPILTKFRVLGITCKFGGIPTINDFIVSLNSTAAPLTNVTYWSVNPGTLGLTDISWHPDGEIIIDGTIGESLNIAWTNAVAQVDWGLRVVVEEVTP